MGIRGLNRVFDGNMKELWDFNRSSVKSYLFFLIYLKRTFCVCCKDPRNKSIREGKKEYIRVFFSVRNKEWSFRYSYVNDSSERRD